MPSSWVSVCAIIGLLGTIYNHLRDVFLLHRSFICQSTWYCLQLSKECVSLVPLVQSLVYWIRSTTIQKMMRLSSPACAVVSLSNTVYNHPRDALLWHCSSEGSLLEVCLCNHRPTGYGHLHRLCRHWFSGYNYDHLWDVFLKFRLYSHRPVGYGLLSSKRCVSSILFVQSSVFWGCVYWYIYWSTGLDLQSSTRCLFLHCWCNYRFIGLGLQSSRGCVYYGIIDACYWSISLGLQSFVGCVYFCVADAPIDLSALVYNCPWDALISALLVHLLIYWFRSTIIQEMRLLRCCRCMLLVYWSRSTIIHGMRLFLHCWYIYRFIGLGL